MINLIKVRQLNLCCVSFPFLDMLTWDLNISSWKIPPIGETLTVVEFWKFAFSVCVDTVNITITPDRRMDLQRMSRDFKRVRHVFPLAGPIQKLNPRGVQWRQYEVCAHLTQAITCCEQELTSANLDILSNFHDPQWRDRGVGLLEIVGVDRNYFLRLDNAGIHWCSMSTQQIPLACPAIQAELSKK